MNKQPVYYMQTDPRWKAVRLKCSGGSMSIGGGGCGPTSAAMLIETLTGKTCLPTETFKWCCDNGYVFDSQGTSYYAFKPLFRRYGIACEMIDIKCLDAVSPVRRSVLARLQEGYYLIALMTKGTWTKGGHYVVVWWADGKIRINDPASKKPERLNGDPDTFFTEAKYFWVVDGRKVNGKDGLDMTKEEFLASLTPEDAYKLYIKACDHMNALPLPTSWDAASELREAQAMGITDGSRPMAPATRLETAIMVKRGRKQ